MKALILNAEKKTAEVQQVPQPLPGTGEILVKVHAIALNPIDPLYVHNPLGNSGRTVGSDFSGKVAALGIDTPSTVQIGQRVAGFLQGACSVNERPGAFAEYLVVPWDLVWTPPDNLQLEEAAGVSLVGLTAAQAIFHRLRLPAPFEWTAEKDKIKHPKAKDQGNDIPFLIYGASTSVGLLAAQFIRASEKVSGQKIILLGAASESRHEMLRQKPYSYDYLVDYRDPNWPQRIQELSGGRGIDFAYNCISEGDTVSKIDKILASNGKQAVVRSRAGKAWKADDLSSEPIYGAVWEGLGVEIQYQGFTVAESPEARSFAVGFYGWLSSSQTIKPVPIRLMPGGLPEVIRDGFVLLGPGTMDERASERKEAWMRPVSAEKLVYLINETAE
jgi:NADPH:quinone reductase-like Zn-dependent oxidoreductase